MTPLEWLAISVAVFDAIIIPAAIILWKTYRKRHLGAGPAPFCPDHPGRPG